MTNAVSLQIVRFSTHHGMSRAAMSRQRMAACALTTPQPEPMTILGAYRVLD